MPIQIILYVHYQNFKESVENTDESFDENINPSIMPEDYIRNSLTQRMVSN